MELLNFISFLWYNIYKFYFATNFQQKTTQKWWYATSRKL